MKKLVPLDEANIRAQTWTSMSAEPIPNGIACPKCGKELWDTLPNVTLTSYPAQKNIHCKHCQYTGYRIA